MLIEEASSNFIVRYLTLFNVYITTKKKKKNNYIRIFS